MKNKYITPKSAQDTRDDTVISEIIVIKREILQSYFDATKTYSSIIRTKSRNKSSPVAEADFGMSCMNLYLKTRPFFKDRKLQRGQLKKDIVEMQNTIDGHILRAEPLDFIRWIKYYFTLQDVIRKLNIYGIGFQKSDPTQAWMEGI